MKSKMSHRARLNKKNRAHSPIASTRQGNAPGLWIAGRWLCLLCCLYLGCEVQKEVSKKSTHSDVAVETEIQSGRRLYLKYGCVTCHGTEGRGDGQAAKDLPMKPVDFRNTHLFKQGYSIQEISDTLEIGVLDGHSKMPAYLQMSKEERELIAKFVLSFQ